MQEEKNNILHSYVAGWVDGDGCIYVNKQKRHYSAFSIKLTDIEPIVFLQKILNIKSNIIFKKPDNRGFKNKPAYEIKAGGTKCIPILENIMPYLIEKQYKAFDLFELYSKKEDAKNVPYLNHSEEEFYAWLAGYFEAEGHVRFRKRTSKKKLKSGEIKIYDVISVNLQLVNTNEFVMNHVLNKLKHYNVINSSKKLNIKKAEKRQCNITKKMINRKPCYRLFLEGSDFLNVQKKILPHFVITRKKEKILKGIEYIKNSKYKRKKIKDYFKNVN